MGSEMPPPAPEGTPSVRDAAVEVSPGVYVTQMRASILRFGKNKTRPLFDIDEVETAVQETETVIREEEA